MSGPLAGKVALVSGATRGGGRGIAVALGEVGATVYLTGRSTREQRSEIDRPETIEETAELVVEAGGEGIPVAVDHLDPEQVRGLVERIDAERGRLDVLENDIWGAEHLFEWDKPVWEHDLDWGLRLLRLAIDTHLVTSHHALPLLIRNPAGLVVEVTDGTADYNAEHLRVNTFYDLAKTSVIRLAWAQAQELRPHGGMAVALTPGWMRSELMLDQPLHGRGGRRRQTGRRRRISLAARLPGHESGPADAPPGELRRGAQPSLRLIVGERERGGGGRVAHRVEADLAADAHAEALDEEPAVLVHGHVPEPRDPQDRPALLAGPAPAEADPDPRVGGGPHHEALVLGRLAAERAVVALVDRTGGSGRERRGGEGQKREAPAHRAQVNTCSRRK